jgi:hypothetical protein
MQQSGPHFPKAEIKDGLPQVYGNTDSKMEETESANFQTFRDSLSTPLIEKSSVEPKTKSRKTRGKSGRKTAIKPVTEEPNDAAEELAEFIDVCLLHSAK